MLEHNALLMGLLSRAHPYLRERHGMSEAEYQSPVDLAIQKLKSKLEMDMSLSPTVRLATIADLASATPQDFSNLKSVLEGSADDTAGAA